ncbi:CRISPR-associated helicase Cas3/CRISPR-associated endonuclease Cas3-HD [Sulfobacillus thermosulfidooxidans DSM 9293]|uniref:CRISPR-associated helicase Cas3/CRISPR-associated endonuclease Cas3-HD n=2 Tax=Sulfobacillus thermosulfidooxidans TaxID=28034 RepID=A0A1W1WHR7_SULTA|nr:CRISPR-associated endonuclease Cas3'' [Sulfobacillus thermosulfidooxidans]PSR25006.1 MAG: CRISPR-associated endonuclease Cas3'' [Sulfobacillus thermosulfidooxidans]SMC05796.1 CRISPR-associated helicase Cas3/CRISPR-associated endonuclease Cas3-HD [Sulfobacillus thermosulfidooxidans DSM 9293]
MAIYLAHTAPKHGGHPQPLNDHLRTVRDLAAQFAKPLGYEDEAGLAGLLHDCGKYGDRFQQRLQGKMAHVDHWTLGAYWAFTVRALAASLAIQGHHVGLQQFSSPFFQSLRDLIENQGRSAAGFVMAGDATDTLTRFIEDGFAINAPTRPVINSYPDSRKAIEFMLTIRFIYSCLVDADFLDTEAHFNQTPDGHKTFRERPPNLNPARALELVKQHVTRLTEISTASPAIQKLRNAVWSAALTASERPGNLWTMTAPTGSGKTLAMLAFALNHAQQFRKRRVIVALPYLNIIEQTAMVYRAVLAEMGVNYVVEHHSLAERNADDQEGSGRLASDNWDAPIVVTTTVQLFESLFANRPGKARKLHNLVDSVIVLDEIQTLPLPVVVPTVAALAALGKVYHATVVLGTATQPAFGCLQPALESITQAQYDPQEIVPTLPPLPVRVHWELRDEPQSWEAMAVELRDYPSFLAIVNLKRHALELAEALGEEDDDSFFHLSTNMCSLHRSHVLDQIRKRLKDGLRTHVVSTQCVEAGVDVDFPVVYRAWGPLDSLVQAAGRCNREGGLPYPGRVVIFQPQDDAYPTGPYQQATQIAKALWREDVFHLDEPEAMRLYWERVYGTTRPHETYSELLEAIQVWDFAGVGERYRLIPETTLQVVVPYAEAFDLYESLVLEARQRGLTRGWSRRAQPLSIGLFRPSPDSSLWSYLEPVLSDQGQESGWWIFRDRAYYSARYGLRVPNQWSLWYS